ncbi:MAG: hypothetical protein KUG77_28750 [Nannocystaceae bacterium]|nr:hypothetical protein [Nannocystaceae bacterium]
MRRFSLKDGQAPPPDAIRTEETVNHFDDDAFRRNEIGKAGVEEYGGQRAWSLRSRPAARCGLGLSLGERRHGCARAGPRRTAEPPEPKPRLAETSPGQARIQR